MEEVWKDIPGYEGLYQVSSLGRVKSLNYNHEGYQKILSFKKERNGYLRVGLFREGRQKLFSVHRLVATVFIPNPNNLPQVNHKDEDKTNNRADNLEWCSCQYNINYGTCLHSISKKVDQYSHSGILLNTFKSVRAAAKAYGCSNSYLGKCIKEGKEFGGYIWRYKEKEAV